MGVAEKRCSVCGELKAATDFYADRGSLRAECKTCTRARMAWRRANPGAPTPNQARRASLAAHGMKRCTSCGQSRALSEFYVDRSASDGRDSWCSECVLGKVAAYVDSNRDAINARVRELREARPERFRQRDRERYVRDREKRLAAGKAYRETRSDFFAAYAREYAEKHRERLTAYRAEYYQRTKEKSRPRRRSYEAKLRERDVRYVISHRISRAIYHSIGSRKAGRAWESLLGYTVDELVQHLEAYFADGITWGNRGEWHIDHIVPQAVFRFEDEDELRVCWSLANLRPMWGHDNQTKHAKLPDGRRASDLSEDERLALVEWVRLGLPVDR